MQHTLEYGNGYTWNTPEEVHIATHLLQNRFYNKHILDAAIQHLSSTAYVLYL